MLSDLFNLDILNLLFYCLFTAMKQFYLREEPSIKCNYTETKTHSNDSSDDTDTDRYVDVCFSKYRTNPLIMESNESIESILSQTPQTRSASTSTTSYSTDSTTDGGQSNNELLDIFEPRTPQTNSERIESFNHHHKQSYNATRGHLISLKPQCIAQQITLLMHDIYVNIPFDGNYATNYYTEQYIRIFNQMVIWIQYSILSAFDSKERAKIIKKWIKCCDPFIKCNNFHGLIAIHCALMSNCVYSGKLKSAWFAHKNIIKKKHRHKLQQIDALVSYEHNYRLRRESMEQSRGPILPYWGIFKRDCLFADEFKNGQNAIHCLVEQYRKYKEGKYAQELRHDQSVQTWIHHQLQETSVLTQEDIRRMSDNVRDLDERTSEKRRLK